jgi:hypothetical protein
MRADVAGGLRRAIRDMVKRLGSLDIDHQFNFGSL